MMDDQGGLVQRIIDMVSGKPGAGNPLPLLIIGGVVLVGLVIAIVVLRRLLAGKPAAVDLEKDRREDLAEYPPAPGQPGAKRLSVEGQPARVRLIVVAPVGKQVAVNEDGVAGFLDQLVRGLGGIVERDKPRIRLWPPQLSNRGFPPTFHRLVRRPEPDGVPSPWVLLAGPARLGKWQVLLGLAVYADEPNTLGRLTLQPHQWAEMLRVS
jgi:hypothetical protein